MSRKPDRSADLRAIADGRLMLNVRNGVTVARSMLARIADEFETMSAALAAKDAELAAVHQRYVDANEARIDAQAALAEARKALEQAEQQLDYGQVDAAHRIIFRATHRAREQGGEM
jgi:multidrug resistance efflux pump